MLIASLPLAVSVYMPRRLLLLLLFKGIAGKVKRGDGGVGMHTT